MAPKRSWRCGTDQPMNSIPRGHLPGRRAKDHHRQLSAVPDILDQVLQVLPDRAIETTIMVLGQQLRHAPPRLQVWASSSPRVAATPGNSGSAWRSQAATPAANTGELARKDGQCGFAVGAVQPNPGPAA